MQLGFARSVDPIIPLDLSITRVALTNADDADRTQESSEEDKAATGQMGRKAIVPYGLYRAHGFFSPHFATQTGVTQKDLELFWAALQNMWDLDRSSSRGMMACRGLYVFTHESSLGNAPAHVLFDRIAVERKSGVEAPRHFSDYVVKVSSKELPKGVALSELI